MAIWARREAVRAAVDRDYEAFAASLDRLLKHYRGRFALMRAGAIVDIFGDWRAAHRAAKERFEDGLYSIQAITDDPIDVTQLCQALDSRNG
ncbi:MAG: hypothetical protein AB7P23_10395 [Amphiplicatus sp.]